MVLTNTKYNCFTIFLANRKELCQCFVVRKQVFPIDGVDGHDSSQVRSEDFVDRMN